jgi:hypothetical protein
VHWAFPPQGDGLQGSGGKDGFGSAETDNKSDTYTCISHTTIKTPAKYVSYTYYMNTIVVAFN